ncbi:nitroreductase family deazaflavin-dependent oxidoreductase [Herbidospora daliensis]|uniref:nitroreductase family deazaflavin-dependent oxidoreductase n=1 Tax=Herbidospora daliensis TaxID=295585 RepID=UPI000780203A|nr:nitroreductase family deazaflavin-dependent oxidoreductase [Herbidospora daliensis]
MPTSSDFLLLTTTGATSGEQTTTPLPYVHHDDLLLVVGSDPAWYDDLLAHPSVQVELAGETFEALAVPAEGARRDELLKQVAHSGYVVILDRVDLGEPREVANLADKLVEIHTWLREQLRHVRAEVDAHFAAQPGEPPSLGLQIRQRCLAFCQALEFHHTSEDGHLFPGMAPHHPHLKATFERLADEHRAVARIQGELASLLADIGAADPRRFRAELDRMAAELNAHLDHEEAALLPLLAEIPWPPPRP